MSQVEKTNIFSMYKTDSSVEATGVEVNYGDNGNGEDTVFVVGRAGGGNESYQKALTSAVRPHRKQIQTGTLSPKVWDKVMLDVYMKTVIKGARGLVDQQGNPIEASAENIRMVLTELPDLFKDIQEQANEAALFRADAVEDIAKNS